MKQKTFVSRIIVMLAMAIFTLHAGFAQDKTDKKQEKKELIERLIQSKNFSFIANFASPMGGRQINLTSLYNIRVSGDTINSDLPYYGRAYVAPMNPTESALRFTTTQFNYQVENRKKGGWDITITPKDAKDVRQMNLSVSANGYAWLQVNSLNRQPISFNGYIAETNSK